jgi:hypothetical protein
MDPDGVAAGPRPEERHLWQAQTYLRWLLFTDATLRLEQGR